jgi:hypothetical protein
MLIEESVIIHSPLQKVWDTFTDITCWKDWNTVLRNVSPEKTEILTEGGKVRFCIYPFSFPVYFEPVIDEVIPHKRVVWSSGVYGLSARHEFVFEEVENGTLATSREVFKGFPVKALRFLFPRSRLRELTVAFLKDLKRAAET